jgi:hypothetical protein
VKIGLYLLRRHALIYSIYWSVMFGVLMVFMGTFDVFGPWILETGRASAWSLAIDVAPSWFMLAMGIVAAVMHLPIAIAHGITRRDFCIGAAVFAIATAVIFQVMKIVGLLLEAWAYQARGLMERLAEPYPWPTVGSTLTDMGRGLAFMLGGWLVALVFYRLRFWWALLVSPIATIPVSSGTGMAYTPWDVHWAFIGAMLVVSAAAGYLAARGLAVKPKKA